MRHNVAGVPFQPGTLMDWRCAVRRPWPSDGRPLPVRPPSDSAESGEVGLRFAISCLCGEVRADQSTRREEEIALVEDNYHRDRIANRQLHPETLMMSYGYAPGLSEGSLKPPIFLTSTFVFENAQQGKDFFDLTSGRRQPRPGEKSGLVYSRFNNPNLEILEDRLAIW